MSDDALEQQETEAAAAEAGAIGGRVEPIGSGTEVDEAQRPLVEAGEGESEGFEQTERLLEEHASHGDQHAARHVISDAAPYDEDERSAAGGEADSEYSSEREGDESDR
jgi:hypothetical protein